MAPNVTRAYSPECVEGFSLLKNTSVSPSEIPSRAQRPALAAFRKRSATILVHRPVEQRLFQQAGVFSEVRKAPVLHRAVCLFAGVASSDQGSTGLRPPIERSNDAGS